MANVTIFSRFFGFLSMAATCLIIFFFLIGSWALLKLIPNYGQTSLIFSLYWVGIAWTAFCLIELCIIWGGFSQQSIATENLRFVAATLTLFPSVSLLGAKRPQDQAWQLIVVSLGVVLLLPLLETFWQLGADSFELGTIRGWFLCGLLAIGFLNYLPTRWWLLAMMHLLGQVYLFAGYLPILDQYAFPRNHLVCIGGYCLLLLVWWLQVVLRKQRRLQQQAGGEQTTSALDLLWKDFRDDYGVLWGVRVQQRFNMAAEQYDWPLRLSWYQCYLNDLLIETEGQQQPITLSLELRKQIEQVFVINLLQKRFVNISWIQNRYQLFEDG